MRKLFDKILCPVDFEQNSFTALDFAVRLAREFGGAIIVLNVVPEPGPATTDRYPVLRGGLTYELETLARDRVQGKVPLRALVRTGDPAQTILTVANELEADVIVMATHGYKGVQRLLLGTVAERVIREATRPVVTIRPQL
jgi:nucleotide-binding universal stress UspA family protein